MYSTQRKTAPRVVGGRVLRKNNHEVTRSFDTPFVTRERPGKGYRHVLAQRDVYEFVTLVPDFDELSRGLSGIVLAAGDPWIDGRIHGGFIYLCAWEGDLTSNLREDYFEEHRDIFARLGVPSDPVKNGRVTCHFDEPSARAYQLLHVFMHELGHHHDSMTTRSKIGNRGEAFAESFAREREAMVWDRYARVMR